MDLGQSGNFLMLYESFINIHYGFFMREGGGGGEAGESLCLSIDSPKNPYLKSNRNYYFKKKN